MGIIRFTSESATPTQSVNVWHFSVDDPVIASDANECVAAVDAFFEAIKTLLAPDIWTHGSRVVTVGPPPNQVVGATPLTTTTTGTSTAPKQVAAGITWRTANIGKSYTGRTYLGPLSNGMLGSDGQSIGSSARTIIQDAADDLLLPTANGGQLVVWSEKLGTAGSVIAADARSALRTQRRRLT